MNEAPGTICNDSSSSSGGGGDGDGSGQAWLGLEDTDAAVQRQQDLQVGEEAFLIVSRMYQS